MKKIIVAIIMATMLLSFAIPVFAGDPPDTQVSVGVVTPGNVDLVVGINAGGNVDVTVDGVDLRQTAAMAQDAFTRGQQNTDWLGTWIYYWKLSGLGVMVQNQLNDLNKVAILLMDAQVQLSQGNKLTNEEVANISTQLDSVKTNTDTSLATINNALSDLKAQDDKTWNQLMNGAEYHLGLLQTTVDEQQQTIVSLQNQFDLQKAQLVVANANYVNLRNYTDYLQRQYLYYFWIMGGVVLAMVVYLVILTKRKA